MPKSIKLKRCQWAEGDPLYEEYHDKEWGRPVHDDKKLFEFLVLESAQAGLSWITVLRKRENYRRVFYNWNIKKISEMTSRDVNRLMKDEGIIRNRAKIEATVELAKEYFKIKKEHGSLDKYLWGFVDGKTRKNQFKKLSDLPSFTKEAEEMSRDLKSRGLKFVGPTICYAFMQAVGMVNDHLIDCPCYNIKS